MKNIFVKYEIEQREIRQLKLLKTTRTTTQMPNYNLKNSLHFFNDGFSSKRTLLFLTKLNQD